MKVFWIGDNSTNANWGRAASLAMHDLLSGEFEIAGCVTGDFFDLSVAKAGYVHTLTPARFYPFLRRFLNGPRQRIAGWYLRLEHLWGAHDFISEDPANSIDNLIAEKHRYPALKQLYEDAVKSDIFVVDGDGDIVFTTPPRRTTLCLLAMIELGLRLRKPVFVVNTMISDCPVTGRNKNTFETVRHLLARCQSVTLRDNESLRVVREEMPGVTASFIPDSLFSWFYRYQGRTSHLKDIRDSHVSYPVANQSSVKPEFSQPYICVGGGALASWYPDKAAEAYGRLVDAISHLGLPIFLTQCDLPDSFLQNVAEKNNIGMILVNAPIDFCGEVLANARLFISGRYHPSIFASLGGTPCIFLGSHAHKMSSLADILEYDAPREFDAFPDDAEIAKIVALAQSYLEEGETLRERIRKVAKTRADQSRALPGFLTEKIHHSHASAGAI